MRKKRKLKNVMFWPATLLLIVGVALTPMPGSVGAQEQQEEEFLLEDVIVTSEFREKPLQETPLSVTAFSADMLEKRSMTNLAEITWQAPNVSLRRGNSEDGSSLVAFIRGIGQTDFNSSVEPGVGIYVDDVYYSTITGNIIDLLDIERVEVLRGPQGTLAGRNSIGGAIKIFTRKADGGDDGYVSLTYGDYDRLDLKGAAGFTIFPDKLFARIAGVSRSRDGYVTSYDYACANNLPAPGNPGGLPTYVPIGAHDCVLGTEGGQSMTAGRLSLRWVPSDKFQVNFAMNIVNDKSEPTPSILLVQADSGNSLIFDPSSPAFVPIFFDNDGDGAYTPGVDVSLNNRFATPGTYYNYATYISDGQSYPNPMFLGSHPGEDLAVYKPWVAPRINHLESEDFALNLDWQMTDNVSLLSVTSYREYTNTWGGDADLSPLGGSQNVNRFVHDQFSQELRLNATLFDGYADLTVGGFYLDQETANDARISGPYYDFAHGPDDTPSENRGLYGQLALNLSDRMHLSLGLRYTEDEKSYLFQRHNPDGTEIEPPLPFLPFFFYGSPANAPVYGADGIFISYSSDQLDYRVALDYDINKDVMVYGQIATGYKAGGNNPRVLFPEQSHAYGPEELTSYEVGVKSTLFDQLRLNASVFFNDFTEIQLPLSVCYWAPEYAQYPCLSQDNIGDADVTGFEVEGLWRPTEAFTVDFSYAYLDFEYTAISTLAAIHIDDKPPYTPENTWSLGAQYELGLGEGWGTLTPRIDVSYQDDMVASTAHPNPYTTIESYTLVNARLTWRSEDGKWEAGLEGTNLTDEYYHLSVYDMQAGEGRYSAQPGRPREYAITFKRYWF